MFIVLPKIFVGTRELRKEGRGRLREGKERKREKCVCGGEQVMRRGKEAEKVQGRERKTPSYSGGTMQ